MDSTVEQVQSLAFEGMPMSNKGQSVTIVRMPLNKIKLGRNSRAKIDKDELEGLMESIKSIGLLQPIGVVKSGTGYDIAYGNRRFLACSKLGLSHIPAIVHTYKKTSEIDIKNLAENVQRKNISLTEVGRYVKLLKGEGMSTGEIAVRLGASRSYVETCEKAYGQVPKEFRDDLVSVVGGNSKKQPGKIPVGAAMGILNSVRTYNLDANQERKLFQAAKNADHFEPKMIPKYAKQIKSGNNNFMKTEKPVKHMRIDLMITQKHFDDLTVKYVDDGPFNSVTALLKAVLKGEKSVKIEIVNEA